MSTAAFGFTLNNPPAGLAATTLHVLRFSGSEAISQLFEFDITLVCDKASVAPEDVLDKTATLTLMYKDGNNATLRSVDYHGVVASWEQVRQYGNNACFYRVTLRPRLWQLDLAPRSDVYLDPNLDSPTHTVKHIVEEVLGRLGNNVSYTLKLYVEAKLRKRAYACQFQESDVNFISRIMEVEGLYFYFDQHATEKDKLIVTNKRTAHLDAPLAEMSYRVDNTTGLEQDSVSAFVPRGERLPRNVVLRDYSEFSSGTNEGPASPPEQRGVGTGFVCTAEVHSRGFGDAMLYGERILSQADGNELAAIRAQELRCRGRSYSGEGSALGLRPGFLTRLKAHYNGALNDKRYLVTRLEHEGEQALAILSSAGAPENPSANTYQARFSAVDHDLQVDGKEAQYRPPLATPRPRFHGTMVAKVDDASTDGYYARPDAQGRYKVLLPFVNNETSPARRGGKGSAWIRMAAPYFGHTTPPQSGAVQGRHYGNHGFHFPLHKDAEVLLAFLEGDPDRPVIVGALANSLTQNVVTDANKTQAVIQTAGGSRLEIEDTEGWERITMSVPYNGSYLRLGAPKVKTSSDPSPPYTGEPDDPGEAAHPKGIYSFYLRSTGKGRYEFPQGFDAITGTNEANFAETYWERYYGWEDDDGANETDPNKKEMLKEADKELNINHNITHTFANNIERTLGDTITTTVGQTIEYTLGNANTQTIGVQKEYVSGGMLSYIGVDVPADKMPAALNLAVLQSDPAVSGRAKPTSDQTKAFREFLEATGQKTVKLPALNEIVAAMRPASKPSGCSQAVWDLGGFGLTPSELAKELYKNPFGWDDARIAKAAKELNFQDSWTHTLGDSIEVTLGKSRSYTHGESWEYTYADSHSQVGKLGHPAHSHETIHGDSASVVYGNSREHIFGGAESTHIGGLAEFFLGGQVSLTAAGQFHTTIGPGLEIGLLGPTTELNAVLLKTCIEAALFIEIGIGNKLEIEPTELKQISLSIKGHALSLDQKGLHLGNNGMDIKQNGLTLKT